MKFANDEKSAIFLNDKLNELEEIMVDHMKKYQNCDGNSLGIADMPTVKPSGAGSKRSRYHFESRSGGSSSSTIVSSSQICDPVPKNQKEDLKNALKMWLKCDSCGFISFYCS